MFVPEADSEGGQVKRLSIGVEISNYLQKKIIKSSIAKVTEGVWDAPIRAKVLFSKQEANISQFEIIINDKSIYSMK